MGHCLIAGSFFIFLLKKFIFKLFFTMKNKDVIGYIINKDNKLIGINKQIKMKFLLQLTILLDLQHFFTNRYIYFC